MTGLSPALAESADHTYAISPDDPAIVEVVNKLVRLWTIGRTVASCTAQPPSKRLGS
jgi:hypothetical protein